MANASVLEAKLQERYGSHHCGVVLAIRADGELAWRHTLGDDADLQVRPQPLRFPIYSITKTLTAVCVLRLSENGIVQLEDSICQWFPNLDLPRSMTLAHALRHTAGLRDYGSLREYHDAVRRSPSQPWTRTEFLDATLKRGLLFLPGGGWAYSNVGYMLLKELIETLCGQTFRNAIRHHVTAPLGLADTFVADNIDDWRVCVPGYGREVDANGELADVRHCYDPGWCAPGVAISTVEDTTRLFDLLFAGKVVSDSSLATMLHLTRVPGDHPPFVAPSYGMGIMADPDFPFGPWFGHGGGGPGYTLCCGILPKSKLGRLSVAVFCNSSDHAIPEQIVTDIVKYVLE